jgi:micrococcal nuclease
MRRIMVALVLCLGGCASVRAQHGSPAPDPCTVARVVDGDTLYCADGRKIRLIGIDSPELGQGTEGRRARDALLALLPRDRRVRLEPDAAGRDRWGRILAYAWSGKLLVNEAMLRGGWALLYTVPPNVKYVRRLEGAQNEARTAGAGLWKGEAFACSPRAYRRRECRPSGTRAPHQEQIGDVVKSQHADE